MVDIAELEKTTMAFNGIRQSKIAGSMITLENLVSISPSQITSDQTDYNPTNLNTASIIRLDADSSFRSIGGLQGGTDGRIIFLENISTNSILLSDEFTTHGQASSAANRFQLLGYDVPLFPKSSIKLRYDGTTARWRFVNGQVPMIPPIRFGFCDKNEWGNASNNQLFTIVSASGGSFNNIAGTTRHHGVRQFTLGTSTTGSGSAWAGGSDIIGPLGNSQYWRFDLLMKIQQLSNATDRYTIRLGFIDSNTAESTDGAFFRYTDNVNSGKWERVTRSNGTETATDTTITAQSSNFSLFTVIVNPAGNNAQFFIDNTSVGANTANIPTGAGRDTSWGIMFLKSAGTTDTGFLRLDAGELTYYSNIIRTT